MIENENINKWQDNSGSVTYWSTLSSKILQFVFHPLIATKILGDFAPGNENVVWMQKHHKHGFGVGIVIEKHDTKHFKVLVCRRADLPKLGELHRKHHELLKSNEETAKAMKGDRAGFEEILDRISDRICMFVRFGSVKGVTTEGKGSGELSTDQFIQRIYPVKTAPYRLKGLTPGSPGVGPSGISHVALELESKNFFDTTAKVASSKAVDSWKNLKEKEKAARLDSQFSSTQMRIAEFYGKREN